MFLYANPQISSHERLQKYDEMSQQSDDATSQMFETEMSGDEMLCDEMLCDEMLCDEMFGDEMSPNDDLQSYFPLFSHIFLKSDQFASLFL